MKNKHSIIYILAFIIIFAAVKSGTAAFYSSQARSNISPIRANNSTYKEDPAVNSITESIFSVKGYDKGSEIWFDWDWISKELQHEYYVVDIKHNDEKTNTYGMRILLFKYEQIISTDGIDENDVSVDWSNDIVKIKKNAFPTKWESIDVKFSNAQTITSPLQSIPYQHWLLNR